MVRSIHQEPVARPPAEVHRLPQLPSGPPPLASLAIFSFFFILLSTRPPCPDVAPLLVTPFACKLPHAI